MENERIERKPHAKSYRRIKIEKDLIKDTTLGRTECAVIFKLLTCNSDFKPSIKGLSTILHTTYKSIRDATEKLKAKGYLKIIITPMGQHNIWKFSQTREFLKDNKEQEQESAEK